MLGSVRIGLTNFASSYLISSGPTIRSPSTLLTLNLEHARSIKSIALSGNFLSVIYFAESFTDSSIASCVIVVA